MTASPVFVQSDAVGGVLLPAGSSSVRFVGVHGKCHRRVRVSVIEVP